MAMAVGRPGVFAALDVGSTKVACFVARNEASGMRVIGIGHQISQGVRGGAVVNMEAAEQAIRAAVDTAERMAGETIRDVYVNLTCGHPTSHTVGVEVALAGHEIGERDIRRVLEQGAARSEPGERQVIHSIPVGYTIDGNRGIRDPRGMFGERLGVDMHVVTAASGPVRNLRLAVERCHLGIAGLAVSPYVAGLSTLVEDEIDLGVTFLEMGGGATSIAVFYDGSLVFTDSVPVGGVHVTNDIARGLSTPVAKAERLKNLYGSAIPSPSDEAEMLDVPLVGENDPESANHIPRSLLVGIIQPRIEEIFEMVRGRLEQAGLDKAFGKRLVLSGGASQLQGVRELAARILDKQVRIGRPLRIAGLADATGGPAFSTSAGLLVWAAQDRPAAGEITATQHEETGSRFARLGRWFMSNF
jgi:cell division protein FtsA